MCAIQFFVEETNNLFLVKRKYFTKTMADTEQKVEETPAAEEPKKPAEEEKPVENGEKTEEAVADGDAKTEEAKDEGGEEKDEAVENHENGKEGEEEEEETPAPSLEAPTENPFTDEDVQQLLDMESGEEGWDKVKEKKGVIVYRKAEKNSSPLIKVSRKRSRWKSSHAKLVDTPIVRLRLGVVA